MKQILKAQWLSLALVSMCFVTLLLPAAVNGELIRAINGPFWKGSDFNLDERSSAGRTETKDRCASLSNQNTHEKVKAGLLNWHTNFESACKAASKSGKPVLLFQILGRLDERFC